jgi:hypothetical protein
MNKILSLIERIENNSIPVTETGCWIWLGATKGNTDITQYGNMTIGSSIDGSRKTIAAHRASYIAYNGDIPNGLWVLHQCDIPCCVNPDHLSLGTRQDNVDDREAKGRNKIEIARKNRWIKK